MTFNEDIVPFVGIDNIKLYSKMEDVQKYLDDNNIAYDSMNWHSQYANNPWTLMFIGNNMSLIFAYNNKLITMVFLENYKGKLPNGICTGMSLDEALSIDNTIALDYWKEHYESQNGYWFEDDLDTKKITDISIFIKEILNDDAFDACEMENDCD